MSLQLTPEKEHKSTQIKMKLHCSDINIILEKEPAPFAPEKEHLHILTNKMNMFLIFPCKQNTHKTISNVNPTSKTIAFVQGCV